MTRRLLLLLCVLWLHACGGNPPRDATSYTVRSGDTLYSIATRLRVDYQDLARWNGIDRDYRIYPGQVLRVRPGAKAPTAKTPAAPNARVERKIPPPSFKWTWPTAGSDFTATVRPNGGLGLTINGAAGQDILAAANGKVVYSGVGLLGYGQLLIIKHDETYLSAYGYAQNVSVREGEQVGMGQKVAVMGQGPAGASSLYFEIRANGRALDPLIFLPRQ